MSLDTAPYIVQQELLEFRSDRFTHYMDLGDKNEIGQLLEVPKINNGICQLGTPNNADMTHENSRIHILEASSFV
jgi:hypothetical protein